MSTPETSIARKTPAHNDANPQGRPNQGELRARQHHSEHGKTYQEANMSDNVVIDPAAWEQHAAWWDEEGQRVRQQYAVER